jgi:hypothetical protein
MNLRIIINTWIMQIIVGLILSGCASSVRAPLPQQGILSAPVREASHIALPMSLDLPALAKDLEKAIDEGALGQESKKESGLQWSLGAKRKGAVRLVARGSVIHCELPLLLQATASGGGRLSMLKTPPVEFDLGLAFDIPLPRPSQGSFALQVPALNVPELPGVLRKSQLAQRIVGDGALSLSALVQNTMLNPMQKKLDAYWAGLQQPIALGSEGWLVLRPDTLVFLGARSMDSNHVEMGFGVVSAVRFSTNKPADLPATRIILVSATSWQPGVHIQLPLQASWQSLQARLTQEIKGKKLGSAKRWLRIDNLELGGIQTTDASGGTANGVRISLDFTAETGSWFAGKKEGVIHLTAFPTLDTATQTFALSGFALTSETKNILLDKGLEWAVDLGYDQVLAKTRLDLGQQLQKPLAKLNAQLKQGLPAGPFKLYGSVGSARFAGLFLDERTLEPWFTLNADFKLGN